VLRIESTSPTAPNLTLVDLPGLFGASDKHQSDDDASLVENLVVTYMKQRLAGLWFEFSVAWEGCEAAEMGLKSALGTYSSYRKLE
jgi:hypothetical protein